MADREKVIRAMEYCTADITPVDENDECLGDVCPFKEGGYESGDCQENMIRAALALLREQEPKVIELSEISPNIYVWVEDRDDGLFPLKGGVIDPDGDDYFRFDENIEKDFVYYPTGTFGKYWRVWNLQPTPEQMRATKWEE